MLTGFSLRYYVFTHFLNSSDIHSALAKFDNNLTSLFISVLLGSAVYLSIVTAYYARPLGRLIQRARSLRRMEIPVEEDSLSAEEVEEEPGEWHDLERAINRLARDLRSKTEALSREREELSTLIGAVTDAILAVDRSGQPLFYNSQFALFFRTAHGGQRALSLSETFRVPEILQGYSAVLETGEPRTITATTHTAHHAVPRHFSISISPLRDSEEKIYGAVGIFHDVTDLKASEQIRIEFVGNASHELRTPLTNIKGYVDTLREDVKTGRMEDAGKFLEIVAKNVDRLLFLANDLLDISTLESGTELRKSHVSVREVTEAALKLLETKRAARRQDIVVEAKAEEVLTDPRRMEQVLVNLVHNAIKYSPEGSRILVAWEKAPGATVLRVKDNGPGIPLEHQQRLFERFYRVDAGRSRELGGTGLGLSIVKHIMIKHGGTVRLASKPGEGAEFICTLPEK